MSIDDEIKFAAEIKWQSLPEDKLCSMELAVKDAFESAARMFYRRGCWDRTLDWMRFSDQLAAAQAKNDRLRKALVEITQLSSLDACMNAIGIAREALKDGES